MGGGQWQVIYLLDGLPEAILLAREGSPLFHEARERGIDVRPIAISTVATLSRRVDLIHAHDARAHTLAALCSRNLLIVSRRVVFPVPNSLFSRWKYARATHYLAISHAVMRNLPVPADKTSVVYDGVPIPVRIKPWSARHDRLLALEAKGGELLRRTGLPIHFCHDLYVELAEAGVFIYLSEMEGLGSAVLAAMAFGVPVVASRAGGLPEAVEHEVTGLLVENNAEAVRSAVSRITSDPPYGESLSSRARQRAIERFSVDVMRAATLAAYEKVLG
jgi:hypothetical protein